MRVDTKLVTFIEEGRIIIDGIEYKPLSSDAVLGEVGELVEWYDKNIIDKNIGYITDYHYIKFDEMKRFKIIIDKLRANLA